MTFGQPGRLVGKNPLMAHGQKQLSRNERIPLLPGPDALFNAAILKRRYLQTPHMCSPTRSHRAPSDGPVQKENGGIYGEFLAVKMPQLSANASKRRFACSIMPGIHKPSMDTTGLPHSRR